MSKYLSRDAILSAETDLKTVEVDVPEWGGTVLVKGMTAKARDRFEADYIRDKGDNIRARLASATVCDDAGKLLFSPADVAKLGEKSAAALDRVFSAALKLNRFSNEDIEELEGNSETAHTANS